MEQSGIYFVTDRIRRMLGTPYLADRGITPSFLMKWYPILPNRGGGTRSGLDVVPPWGDRVAEWALAIRWTVCLLCSCRRTFFLLFAASLLFLAMSARLSTRRRFWFWIMGQDLKINPDPGTSPPTASWEMDTDAWVKSSDLFTPNENERESEDFLWCFPLHTVFYRPHSEGMGKVLFSQVTGVYLLTFRGGYTHQVWQEVPSQVRIGYPRPGLHGGTPPGRNSKGIVDIRWAACLLCSHKTFLLWNFFAFAWCEHPLRLKVTLFV